MIETKQDKLFNIFCLPPAGSSSSIYHNWNEHVQKNINIIPLDYPGHGKNIQLPLSDQPDLVAEQIVSEIKKNADKCYALFGHSVGGSVLWRVEEKLKTYPELYQKLMLLVISGRPAPQYLKAMNKKSELTDQALIKEVKSYNNFPDEILNNKDTFDFFMRILKNDFKLSDAMLNDSPTLTQKPVMCIYGKDDPFIPNHLMMTAWQNYTTQWIDTYCVKGDHFYFLNQQILKQTLDLISIHISKIASHYAD